MSRAFLMSSVCAVLLVGSCAEAGERDRPVAVPSSTGSSLFDQLEAARGKHAREAADKPEAVAPSAEMRELGALWKSFLEQQAGWPERREEWCRRGPAARALLVENLIRTMMRARDAGEGSLFHRCRKELLEHREPATALFVEALASHRGDQVLRNLAAETLAFFGPASAAPLINAARGADEPGQRAILGALKLLDAAEARVFLEEVAAGESSFAVRIEALDGLARIAAAESAAVCRACLQDRDPSVRRFAFKLAGQLKSSAAVLLPHVLDAWQRSLLAGEMELSRAGHWSARQLAGRDHGADPARWPRGKEAP